MVNVSAKELRLKLTHYLDLLEAGEEMTIIRNSCVIGYIKPVGDIQQAEMQIQNQCILPDGSKVTFRQPGMYEDLSSAVQLFPESECSEIDLAYGPAIYYESQAGEFWIGEHDNVIVAAGGFMLCYNYAKQDAELKIKRVTAASELKSQGLEEYLVDFLNARISEQT